MKNKTYIVKLVKRGTRVSKEFLSTFTAIRNERASKAQKTTFTLKGL